MTHDASVCSIAAEFSSAINRTVLMRRIAVVCALLACMSLTVEQPRTLDIYFIDVEGGQSTLVVTPAGESLLIDTGFPSDGTFQSVPGDPAQARDANRIVAAARAAGIKRLDYVLLTHFHADHDGGVVSCHSYYQFERSSITARRVPRWRASRAHSRCSRRMQRFVRSRGHVEPAAGARLPLKICRCADRQRSRCDDQHAGHRCWRANPLLRAGRRFTGGTQRKSPLDRSSASVPRVTVLDVGDLGGNRSTRLLVRRV